MREGASRQGSASALYAVTFLAQALMVVVGINVPIYAYGLGASPLLLGVIGAAGGATYSVMPVVFGRVSRGSLRRALISAAMAAYGLAGLLYALCGEPRVLILIKVVEWTAAGLFWPNVEAMIADTTGEEGLGRALRRFNVSWGTGIVVGPLVWSLLSARGVRTPFYVSSAGALSMGVLTLLLVRESELPGHVPGGRPTGDDPKGPRSAGPAAWDRRSIFVVLTAVVSFGFVVGILTALFPAFATELGITDYGIGLIMLVFGATRTLAFLGASGIERRLKRAGMFLLSSAVFVGSSAVTALGPTAPPSTALLTFTACFAAFGLGTGMAYSASISFVLGEWGLARGYAAGVFEGLLGLGGFVGPLAGGAVSQAIGLQAPYFLTALVTAAVGLSQLVLLRGSRSLVPRRDP